ncbi:MAG: tRNA epoxyqueuosine(34) reductase QueG [Chloroflexi bacterium]|nr:MAG: tRNA epoxyqueuosine(34) reductase QueG [Chloroflexota bacterium]
MSDTMAGIPAPQPAGEATGDAAAGNPAARERVERLAARHGLNLLGIAPAEPLLEARDRMQQSVREGRMARMDWMGGDRPEIATDPRRLDPTARSVIVVAAPYAGAARASWDAGAGTLPPLLREALAGEPATPTGLIARYALGTDYHLALRDRLDGLAEELRRDGIPAGATSFVDDRPLAERAFAARAGLGWIGKNTNLLTHHPAGSWVFLGAILSSAELPVDEPIRSSCGSCRRCIDGCPTGAIIGPQTIDANRCISYLTIEHPGELATDAARAIGAWIFGCDVCQEVCPVNAEADDPGPLRVPLLPLGERLLPLGARAFQRAFGQSALRRAGRHRLLRNVIIALSNALDAGDLPPGTVTGVERFLEAAARDSRDEVRAHASRALVALHAGT